MRQSSHRRAYLSGGVARLPPLARQPDVAGQREGRHLVVDDGVAPVAVDGPGAALGRDADDDAGVPVAVDGDVAGAGADGALGVPEAGAAAPAVEVLDLPDAVADGAERVAGLAGDVGDEDRAPPRVVGGVAHGRVVAAEVGAGVRVGGDLADAAAGLAQRDGDHPLLDGRGVDGRGRRGGDHGDFVMLMIRGITKVPMKIRPIPRAISDFVFEMCPKMPMTNPTSMSAMNGQGDAPKVGVSSKMLAMSRPTLLSGALLAALNFTAQAHATTWDVFFSGSGTSAASYHADEFDKTDPDGRPKCEQGSWDYSESAAFRWSYRWRHVHLDGQREIVDPSRHQGSGSEDAPHLFGACRGDEGGPYDCNYTIRPGFNASFLYSQRVRGRL